MSSELEKYPVYDPQHACPKCGGCLQLPTYHTDFCLDPQENPFKLFAPQAKWIEWLERECRTCGHVATERCLDAAPVLPTPSDTHTLDALCATIQRRFVRLALLRNELESVVVRIEKAARELRLPTELSEVLESQKHVGAPEPEAD